jgi:serine/threonine protein kinase
VANDVFGLVGQTIDGRYRVDAPIGEGGFGVVYRGHHLSFDHAIAIKCLKIPGHFTDEGRETFLKKFQEEGKMLSKLSHHPAIVRVFDLGVVTAKGGQTPYLVLEWLTGRPLSERMLELRAGGQRLDEAQAVALVRPVIEALASVHDEGIAHRDVKPENIFLIEGGKGSPAKLLDFGIAKAMQEGERITRVASRTSSNFSAFSPKHGAPEQFRSKAFGATGPWTDVHAIGIILSELTSGAEAITGEDFGDMLVSATEPARPTPRKLGAQVSDAFEGLVAKAVALDPRQRFASARELLAELEQVVPLPGRSSLDRVSAGPSPAARASTTPALPLAFDAPLTSHGAATPRASNDGRTVVAAPITSLDAARTGAFKSDTPARSRTAVIALGAAALAAAAGVAVWLGVRDAPSDPSSRATASEALRTSTAAPVTAAPASASTAAFAGQRRIRVGALAVSGRLPPDVIRRVLHSRLQSAGKCYELALQTDPTLAGEVVFGFTVDEEGAVTDVKSLGALPSEPMKACVGKALGAAQLPKPEGGVVRVVYPLAFSTGPGEGLVIVEGTQADPPPIYEVEPAGSEAAPPPPPPPPPPPSRMKHNPAGI